jgi:hypothetical protein
MRRRTVTVFSIISVIALLTIITPPVHGQSIDAAHKALRLVADPECGHPGPTLAGAEVTLKKIGVSTEIVGYVGPDGTLLASPDDPGAAPLPIESGDWIGVLSLAGYEIFTFNKRISEGIEGLPNPEASEFICLVPISRPIRLSMEKDSGLSLGELAGASITIVGKKDDKTVVGHVGTDGVVLNEREQEVTLGPGDYTLRITHEGLLGAAFSLTIPDTPYNSPAKYVTVAIGPKKPLIPIGDLTSIRGLIPTLGPESPGSPESVWEYVTKALLLITAVLLLAILVVMRRRRAARARPALSTPKEEKRSRRSKTPAVTPAPRAASVGENRFVGTRFADYLVTRTIARGGMAYVAEARFERGGKTQRAALKIPYEDYQQDKEFRRRFDQEAGLGDVLFHENIIKIYEYGKNRDGVAFIAMEYIDGCDLRDLLRKKKRLDPRRAAEIVMDIAKALDYAHGQSPPVYHRDIKPENIMFRDKQGKTTAILTDFGIASQGMTMGTGKALIGTALYSCPDAIKGIRVSPAYDIYSLGVVFYEMVTGRTPFSGDSYYTVMRRHEDEIPKAPIKINKKVPPEIDRIIMKMLEKDPKKRYTTAKGLLRALRDYLKG